MKVSKFVKPHKDILIEYIYDDGNNISESYKILQNVRDNSLSYLSGSSSVTNNSPGNQLIQLDAVTNNYGVLNTNTYAFLQLRDYASGFPIRHDKIKIHLPVNYTFGEYLGFYIKVFAFDYNNNKPYTLSNFYFDTSNIDQSYLLGYNSPAFLFQEKLWGKNISIEIPSVYAVSRQRVGTGVKSNSINANLTNSFGLSLTTPVFIDFHFITQKRTINSIVSYNLTAKTSLSVPQAPDFENIGVKIQHSPFGDYFEIFGTFNGDINQFDNFIQTSVASGNRYYVNFTITLFEQNIRGKTFTITLTENFNEKIEYRPIIKFSTTTAIIDVEMNMIDAVDESSIYRKASYGMLQDEVAKYSLNLTKINVSNAFKPKIYNIKSPEGAGIFGNSKGRVKKSTSQAPQNGTLSNFSNQQIRVETVKVNYAVLANMFTVIAKSDNAVVGKDTFYGLGKLEVVLQPFDNILKFKIAQDVTQITTAPTLRASNQVSASPKYMDLTGMGEIKLVIKNPQLYFETTLYIASNEIDLANGIVVFRILSTKMSDIRKIYESGYNIFYITSSTDTGTVVIYSGLFMIYDTLTNIATLQSQALSEQRASASNQTNSAVVDPELTQQGTAIVTLQEVGTLNTNNNFTTSNSTATKATSVESTTKFSNKTYTIDSNSNLIIDGFAWAPNNIKEVLGLSTAPTQLSFKSDAIYSNNKLLEKLTTLEDKLKNKFIQDKDSKDVLNEIQNSFRIENEGGD